MNQSDLGLKITELRQQKGFTQEKLAEYCEVSTRTIQRIESGEVEPRAFRKASPLSAQHSVRQLNVFMAIPSLLSDSLRFSFR